MYGPRTKRRRTQLTRRRPGPSATALSVAAGLDYRARTRRDRFTVTGRSKSPFPAVLVVCHDRRASTPRRLRRGDRRILPGKLAGGRDHGSVGVVDGKFTVASNVAYPPFEFSPKGRPEGFDIDLMNEIARRAGFEVKYENVQFDSILRGLDADLFDASISAMTITTEREKQIDFSDPYFDADQALLVASQFEDQDGRRPRRCPRRRPGRLDGPAQGRRAPRRRADRGGQTLQDHRGGLHGSQGREDRRGHLRPLRRAQEGNGERRGDQVRRVHPDGRAIRDSVPQRQPARRARQPGALRRSKKTAPTRSSTRSGSACPPRRSRRELFGSAPHATRFALRLSARRFAPCQQLASACQQRFGLARR